MIDKIKQIWNLKISDNEDEKIYWKESYEFT